MAIVYRTNGAWGTGQGSRLSKAQVDGNFYYHDTRITALEGALPSAARGIDHITSTTDTLTVVYSDSSTDGPFPLPVASYPFKGTWAPSTPYAKRDTFNINGSFYEVLVPHTSALTFDPAATDGLGHDLYGLRMTNPGATLPTGGATDYIMYKESGADFDIGWRPSGVPRAGTAGQSLRKLSNSDFDTAWSTDSQALANLTDVALYLPNSGHVLEYDGAHWVNIPQSSLGISYTQLFDHATPAQNRNPIVTDLGSVSGSVTFDPSLGDIFLLTPTGNITSLGSSGSVPPGARITFIITTSGTTPYNVVFSGGFQNPRLFNTGDISAQVYTITFISNGLFWQEESRTPYESAKTLTTTTGSQGFDFTQTDFSLATITPTGNCTFTVPNTGAPRAGRRVTFKIITSGTSSFNITFSSNFVSTGVLATGTVSGKTFTVDFISDGSKLIELARTVAM